MTVVCGAFFARPGIFLHLRFYRPNSLVFVSTEEPFLPLVVYLQRRICVLGRVWVDNGNAVFVLDITTERDEHFLRGMVESSVTLRVRQRITFDADGAMVSFCGPLWLTVGPGLGCPFARVGG